MPCVNAELDLTVVARRDLIGKDGGMYSKARRSSDSFVKVTVGELDAGKTEVVEKEPQPRVERDDLRWI